MRAFFCSASADEKIPTEQRYPKLFLECWDVISVYCLLFGHCFQVPLQLIDNCPFLRLYIEMLLIQQRTVNGYPLASGFLRL